MEMENLLAELLATKRAVNRRLGEVRLRRTIRFAVSLENIYRSP